MGAGYICVFNLIAYSARTAGVSVTSVANKLSLVIPFIMSVYLYNEKVTVWNITGILLALASVILVCYPSEKIKTVNKSIYILPIVLFISSGLLDSMLKYVENTHVTGEGYNAFLVTSFLSAASFGAVVLFTQFIFKKQQFSTKALLAGIIIGVPNYFSIFTLLKALEYYPGKSAMVIPVNNMGIVLFSAVAAWIIFKERLSVLNKTGILLSLFAIFLIAFG